MSTFWLTFIVSEAVGVGEAFVSMSSLPAGVKAAIENFIQAGEALVLAIKAGK